jgi:oxygen-independent coproporphyrinogen-3 oxidase
MKTYGIYIHVPFCRKKCDYCGFYSIPVFEYRPDTGVPGAFITRCINEFEERLSGRDVSADSVYLGGGTPSLLTVEQAGRLLMSLKRRVRIDANPEITVEMNPEDVSREKLEGYRDAGVNRIVLGVQTLSERLLGVIGRSARACTKSMLDDFFSVSGMQHAIDVITGIPSQKDSELLLDLDTLAGYRPMHISAYLLSIEKNTPLGRRSNIDPAAELIQARQYELTTSQLEHHGFERYEISNYALPGGRSRHNMKYWRFEPYFGFGPGAHSFIDGERYYNEMPVADYITSVHTVLRQDYRKPESVIVEWVLTGLRLISGISITELEHRLNYPVPETVMDRIRDAQSDGKIIIDKEGGDVNIRLSPQGIIFADSVIYRIVEPLL